eukprot:26222_1
MASKHFNQYTIHFSQTSCPQVRDLLIKEDEICLSESSQSLSKAVDFVTRDYGIVYVTEREINGKVEAFLPRILTLIYQRKYLKARNLLNDNDGMYGKRKKFEFRKKIVYIHYHQENSEKTLSLQLFCRDHEIPTVLVQDAAHVAKLIKCIARSAYQRFIIPSTSAIDNDWGKDHALLNGSLKQIILKLPYVTDRNNEQVIKHFKCMGAIVNANRDQLRVAFSNNKAVFLHKFFR